MADKSYANLYWVTTEDHDEDWFIIARSEAREYHVETEGYDWDCGAKAKLILELKADEVSGGLPRHAQLDDLSKLGFEVLNPDPNARSVRLGKCTFVEGHLQSLIAARTDGMFEQRGEGRPGGTKRRPPN